MKKRTSLDHLQFKYFCWSNSFVEKTEPVIIWLLNIDSVVFSNIIVMIVWITLRILTDLHCVGKICFENI